MLTSIISPFPLALILTSPAPLLAMVAQNRSSMANDVLGGFGGMKL